MKTAIGVICLVCGLIAVQPAFAISLVLVDSPFEDRSSVGGHIGVGVPNGQFGSVNNGNHESGGLDWALELEHYFGLETSLGFYFASGTYDDKEFGDELQTKLNTFGGFFRYVFILQGEVYPFIRFGLGGMEVEFDSVEENVDAERSASVDIGGGAIWMVNDNIGIKGQAVYTHGWTEEAYISAADAIVGFDVSYWAFDVGIGFYFARLWYYEKLYPLVFSVSALGRAMCLPVPEPNP